MPRPHGCGRWFFPTQPLIGLLLRLVYQHYARDIDTALREAGFDDVRPAAANVFPFVPPEGITVSELAEGDRRSRLVLLTDRGASVPQATHAAAARVEARWREMTSPEELEALRAALLRLLTELRHR